MQGADRVTATIDGRAAATPASLAPDRPRAPGFLAELESVRGLAALSVAVFHAVHVVPVDGNVRVYLNKLTDFDSLTAGVMRLLMVVFSGGAAVSMFFVLSGFVLMLSLIRDRKTPGRLALGFIVRRMLRIYPALAVNIVVMAVAFRMPIDSAFENLALLKSSVNGASWSLFVEIFAIPLLLATWAVTRIGGSVGLAIVIIISVAAPFSNSISQGTELGLYWFMFAFGMGAAWWGPKRLSAHPLAIVTALVALLCARLLLGYGSRWSLLVEGIASTYIIAALAFATPTSVHGLLHSTGLGFLGRTSYSFYLYHPLALGTMIPYLLPLHTSIGPIATALAMSVATVAITLLLAWLSFVAVEAPFVRLGKRA